MTGCKTLQDEFDAVVAGLRDVVAKGKPYEEPIPGGHEREQENDEGAFPDQESEEVSRRGRTPEAPSRQRGGRDGR